MGGKDKQSLHSYLGDSLFRDYMLIRNKIPKDYNGYKDFQLLKNKSVEDIRNFISTFQSKTSIRKQNRQDGAVKLYEDSEWSVYRVTSYKASCLYGKGTKWCVSSKKGTATKSGETIFNEYKDETDGGLYVYFSKSDKRKYCLLQTKDRIVDSIWNDKDILLGADRSNIGIDLPPVKEVNLEDYTFFGLAYAISKSRISDVKRHLQFGKLTPDFLNTMNYPDTCMTHGVKGHTILMAAVRYSTVPIVRLLLEYGADPNIENSKHDRALLEGLHKPVMVEELLRHGANPNITYVNDFTPLHLSFSSEIKREDTNKVVRLLLKYGANPNSVDLLGNTPLILATTYDFLECVELLVNHGANVNVTDSRGFSPLDLAICSSVNKKMEKFLLSHGARELYKETKTC